MNPGHHDLVRACVLNYMHAYTRTHTQIVGTITHTHTRTRSHRFLTQTITRTCIRTHCLQTHTHLVYSYKHVMPTRIVSITTNTLCPHAL